MHQKLKSAENILCTPELWIGNMSDMTMRLANNINQYFTQQLFFLIHMYNTVPHNQCFVKKIYRTIRYGFFSNFFKNFITNIFINFKLYIN